MDIVNVKSWLSCAERVVTMKPGESCKASYNLLSPLTENIGKSNSPVECQTLRENTFRLNASYSKVHRLECEGEGNGFSRHLDLLLK